MAYTQIDPSDFRLRTASVGVGFHDRVEVSLVRQRFGLGSTVPGVSIEQDIVGVKLTAAWTRRGTIADKERQEGLYLSGQLSY